MSEITTFYKDPDAVLDFTHDYENWLAGDAIASAAVDVPEGLTLDRPELFTDTTVTFWLAGGVEGQTYRVRCRITTTAGRIDDRTTTFKIVSR